MKTDKYLIHYKGVGRLIELSTRETTSEQFGEMQRSFANEVGKNEKDWPFADMIRLYPDQVQNGVFYSWGLASADGAWFNLIALPDTLPEQIEQAKKQIRYNQDVVSMSVTRINKLLQEEAQNEISNLCEKG
ncbi:MAG: hypothetical protein WC332_01000 [Clostridia bacterium]|jgi:hypothetical protein